MRDSSSPSLPRVYRPWSTARRRLAERTGADSCAALPLEGKLCTTRYVWRGPSSTLRLTAEKKGLERMVEQPERYCTHCGHELKPDDQFCTNCGVPVHRAARVPTPEADRPVPPLPSPTQEVGGRRSLPGSGALRGRGSKLVVLLVLGVLVLYLVPPLVVESLIAGRVQTALELDTQTKPNVEVSSIFPPMMFLGRIDSVQVTLDQPDLQGGPLYNKSANFQGVSVSMPSLIGGNPSIVAENCSRHIDQIQCRQVSE